METGMTVNQMSCQVNEVQEMLSTLVLESTEDREKSLQSLVNKILLPSPTDSAQEWYSKMNKARIPGTGNWVRTEDVFQSWLTGDMPIIFVSGNPGAGKSYLSTNIISLLREQYAPSSQSRSLISVGFFFFKDDNPDTRSIHQALRDLAFQISQSDPVYQKYVVTIEHFERISNLESAWRLLFVDYFLKKPNVNSSVYILLDAVDEASDEERRIFLSLAKDLYDAPGIPRLQLAIVGRPHISYQLLEGLDFDVPTIHVTTLKNSGDINQYIHASIKKSVILRRVSVKLRQEIVEKLSAGAEGMFLWVNLMLQELVKKRNESSIRKALDDPPKGLKETLRHVLLNFSNSSVEEELEYLNEILIWVTCSQQPLTLGFIDKILRLRSPEGDGMIYLEGTLRRQFASFFTLDRADALTTAELQNMSTKPDLFDGSDNDEMSKNDQEAFEDAENFTDFNSDLQTTTVTFCHASIGDFFRDETEGKVSAGESHFAVGVNYREAKVHVLKTFLRLFTDSDFAKRTDNSKMMLNHAALNWVHHLSTTSPSWCSLEDRKEIAKLLLTAFRSKEVISVWNGCRGWVSTNANIQAVRQWWKDEEVFISLSESEREFISSTEKDPITTFKPVVMFCVQKWLCDSIGDVFPLAAVVCSYQALIKGKELNFMTNFNPTAAELVEAADFGDLEKTALWYRRCAMALRQAKHYDAALGLFAKALALDPNEWLTRMGIALTYTLQKQYRKAIELEEEVAKTISEEIKVAPDNKDLKLHLHALFERMGNSYKQLGDLEKWFESFTRAYECIPYCNTCINVHLEHHNSNHDPQATIDLLTQLADTPVPDEGYSRLTQTVWLNSNNSQFFGFILDAALALGTLSQVVESWQVAAKAARKALKTVTAAQIELHLASTYSEYLEDHAKAVKRWENIMNTYASSKDLTSIGIVKLEAATYLARHYLLEAVNAGISTPEAEEMAKKLEKLVMQDKGAIFSLSLSLQNPATPNLAVYHRLRGQQAEAHTMVRPLIKHAIHILSDDDPENDLMGLIDLSVALLAVRDTESVITLTYALGTYEEDQVDECMTHTCDGPCHQEWRILDNFSLCSICFNMFCQDCVQRRAEGSVATNRCFSTHGKSFVHVPPRPKKVAKGSVLVKGEVMQFEAWKNLLRQKWCL
jgi:tetratricopeptide (TPR) repeat protein